jgi:hypothetical protein
MSKKVEISLAYPLAFPSPFGEGLGVRSKPQTSYLCLYGTVIESNKRT